MPSAETTNELKIPPTTEPPFADVPLPPSLIAEARLLAPEALAMNGALPERLRSPKELNGPRYASSS